MTVLVQKSGAVARVTLNRPEVRNAFNEATLGELTQAFRSFSKDKALRAVIIGGTGPSFCAGADIQWMRRAADYKPAQNKKDATRLVAMCRTIDECPVPVITRVHGVCYGGGLGIVAASDIAIAAEDAQLAFSECRLGILPAVVSSFVIPKIGVAQARRYFLTAETFSAQTALSLGLVHDVAPENNLDERVDKILTWILKAGPQAVREAKILIRKASALAMDARIRYTIGTLARVRASSEAKEGLSAFLEKRPPSWVQASAPVPK